MICKVLTLVFGFGCLFFLVRDALRHRDAIKEINERLKIIDDTKKEIEKRILQYEKERPADE